MRTLCLATLVAAFVGLAFASSASAAPAIGGSALAQAVGFTDEAMPAAGGCGRGWHRNWRGRCVPNRRWRW